MYTKLPTVGGDSEGSALVYLPIRVGLHDSNKGVRNVSIGFSTDRTTEVDHIIKVVDSSETEEVHESVCT